MSIVAITCCDSVYTSPRPGSPSLAWPWTGLLFQKRIRKGRHMVTWWYGAKVVKAWLLALCSSCCRSTPMTVCTYLCQPRGWAVLGSCLVHLAGQVIGIYFPGKPRESRSVDEYATEFEITGLQEIWAQGVGQRGSGGELEWRASGKPKVHVQNPIGPISNLNIGNKKLDAQSF